MKLAAQQRGVAVITALLIVTLAITVSAGIATDLQLEVRRTANLVNSDQAMMYITPAEKLASNVLTEDGKANQVDHLTEAWAYDIPPIPVEGGQIIGKITDLQGCFNVNSVDPGIAAQPPAGRSQGQNQNQNQNRNQTQDSPQPPPTANLMAKQRLRQLLSLPDINIDANAVDALIDWIDADTTTTIPSGAEDGYYLSLERPYRAANQTLKSISTLRLVRGFEDPVKLNALLPFVCALDANTAINVNTAPAEVLLSLDDNIVRSDIDTVISTREDTPFNNVNEFLAIGTLGSTISDTGSLSVSSQYFLLTSTLQIGNARRVVYSVISRDSTAKTTIISRTQNSL